MKYKYIGIIDLTAIFILYTFSLYLNIVPRYIFNVFPYLLFVLLTGIILSIIFGSNINVKIRKMLYSIIFVIFYLIILFSLYYLFIFMNLDISILSFIYLLTFLTVFLYLVLLSIRDIFVVIYIRENKKS